MSYLPGMIPLGLISAAALLLTRLRRRPVTGRRDRLLATSIMLVTILMQFTHFLEESAGGFHIRFPGMFGLSPIPFPAFVGFNLAWFAIWAGSIPGLLSGRTPAWFAIWFLCLAGIVNGIAHPLLSLVTGAYFPGLYTSTAVFLASLLLLHRLLSLTRRLPG